jgi:hypothetical protein
MQPSLMTPKRVNPRHFVDGQTIVDVVPIVGRCVGRVDAKRFDGVDNLQHAFDFSQPDSRNRTSPPGRT